jgi:hypothetical protein
MAGTLETELRDLSRLDDGRLAEMFQQEAMIRSFSRRSTRS